MFKLLINALTTSLLRTPDTDWPLYSRRDIIEFLGVDERRVTNTYQPLDIPEHLTRRTDDEVATELGHAFGLDFGGYFFYGAIEPKKICRALSMAMLPQARSLL